MSEHQANHARILALRAEADALEAQLKSSVKTLADLRHELLETPATALPENARPVPLDELLLFARHISKHTVPPTYREPVAKHDGEGEKDKEEPGSQIPSNGTGTPAVASAVSAADEGPKDAKEGEAEGPKPMTAEQAEWLKKLQESGFQWTPWPDMNKIRRGNLMSIQIKLDKRQPLTSHEPTAPQEMVLDDRAPEEKEPEVRRESVTAPVHRPSMHHQPSQPAAFTGFDDFDDDD